MRPSMKPRLVRTPGRVDTYLIHRTVTAMVTTARVSGGFPETCGYPSGLLEFGKAAFDEMALGIEVLGQRVFLGTGRVVGDHRHRASVAAMAVRRRPPSWAVAAMMMAAGRCPRSGGACISFSLRFADWVFSRIRRPFIRVLPGENL